MYLVIIWYFATITSIATASLNELYAVSYTKTFYYIYTINISLQFILWTIFSIYISLYNCNFSMYYFQNVQIFKTIIIFLLLGFIANIYTSIEFDRNLFDYILFYSSVMGSFLLFLTVIVKCCYDTLYEHYTVSQIPTPPAYSEADYIRPPIHGAPPPYTPSKPINSVTNV
jgi:hypothetical protein